MLIWYTLTYFIIGFVFVSGMLYIIKDSTASSGIFVWLVLIWPFALLLGIILSISELIKLYMKWLCEK